MWFEETNPEHYQFSGPHVWPKTSGYQAVDRYIFRRPELAYLMARDTYLKEQYGARKIRAVIREKRKTKHGYRTKQIGAFHHVINKPDTEEDVRTFLVELRRTLYRLLPDNMFPALRIVIAFYPENNNRDALEIFTERWL